MKLLFKLEWKRAWHSRYSKWMLIIGLLFAVVAAGESFRTHVIYQLQQGIYLIQGSGPNSITQVWFGMDISTMFNALYMLLLPILAVLPYAPLLYDDHASGYLNQMLIREDRRRYFMVRYLVNFIMGGIGAILPSVVNLLIGALYAPVIPQIPSEMQAPISDLSFGAALFYDRVVIYILIYLVLDFVWGGLYADLVFVFLDHVRNKYILLALPFVIHVVIYYVVVYSQTLGDLDMISIIPYSFLNPMQWEVLKPLCVGGMTLLVFMITVNEAVFRNLRRDVL